MGTAAAGAGSALAGAAGTAGTALGSAAGAAGSALGSAATAAGSGISSAASGLGSSLGIGGSTAAPSVSAAGATAAPSTASIGASAAQSLGMGNPALYTGQVAGQGSPGFLSSLSTADKLKLGQALLSTGQGMGGGGKPPPQQGPILPPSMPPANRPMTPLPGPSQGSQLPASQYLARLRQLGGMGLY